MNPFSSDRFFNDAFFTEPVTIDGAEYAAVTSNIDELKTEGKIASKTGQWLKVAIPRAALADLPCRGGKLEARGAVYRIEDIVISGDIVRLSCITGQRFVK